MAAEVKSRLASKLGRTRSIEARMRSKDGLGLSADNLRWLGFSIGGSRDIRCLV